MNYLHFRPVFSTAVKGWIRISVSLDEFSLQQKINITINILNIHTHSRIHPYPLVSGLLDPSGPVMAPLVKVLLCHRRHELWVLHPVLLTRHHAVLLLLTSVRKWWGHWKDWHKTLLKNHAKTIVFTAVSKGLHNISTKLCPVIFRSDIIWFIIPSHPT